jgi:hypothetical protein
MTNQLRVCVRVFSAVRDRARYRSCPPLWLLTAVCSSVAAALFFSGFLIFPLRFSAFPFEEIRGMYMWVTGIPGMHMWV